MDRLPSITPAELLNEECLQPLGGNQYRLAKATGVPASRSSAIVPGQRAPVLLSSSGRGTPRGGRCACSR